MQYRETPLDEGDAYDNALAESFFATLDCELLERRRFRAREEARVAIFEYLEAFYNPRGETPRLRTRVQSSTRGGTRRGR